MIGIVQPQHLPIFNLKQTPDTPAHDARYRKTMMATAGNISTLKGAKTNGLQSLFEVAKTRFARYRIYRQTVNELSALSNRELADLGLHRSMIRRLAQQASEDYITR